MKSHPTFQTVSILLSKVIVCLVIVELQPHAVVDLVVCQRDVVLVHVVPLLDSDLLGTRAGLSCD